MNTDTPKTDTLAAKLFLESESGSLTMRGMKVADELSDFARELEQENTAMRQAMKNVYDMLDGMDEQLEGNRGMFILMAQDELRPFIGP